VAETSLRYLQPARLDDRLSVTVTLRERGRATMLFEQGVWRDDALLTTGLVRIGWVQKAADGTLKPGRIPAHIVSALPETLAPARPISSNPA